MLLAAVTHCEELDIRGWCVACLDPRASRLRCVVQGFSTGDKPCLEDVERVSLHHQPPSCSPLFTFFFNLERGF